MGVKNIIFDFGGVLMDWDPRYLYRNIFEDKKEMEYFLNSVCTLDWNAKLDEGFSFSEATSQMAIKFPQYEKEIKMYQTHWIQMIGGAITQNVSLISQLKPKYRLFGLTNWSAETFPLVYDQYSFFKEFEGIVVSGTEKLIKPGFEIYKVLLDRYQLNANESLFIDDNADNITTAKKIGFETIHLTKEVNLKNELINLGIG